LDIARHARLRFAQIGLAAIGGIAVAVGPSRLARRDRAPLRAASRLRMREDARLTRRRPASVGRIGRGNARPLAHRFARGTAARAQARHGARRVCVPCLERCLGSGNVRLGRGVAAAVVAGSFRHVHVRHRRCVDRGVQAAVRSGHCTRSRIHARSARLAAAIVRPARALRARQEQGGNRRQTQRGQPRSIDRIEVPWPSVRGDTHLPRSPAPYNSSRPIGREIGSRGAFRRICVTYGIVRA